MIQALLLAALPLLSSPVALQTAPDLDAMIRERVQAAHGQSVSEVMHTAEGLVGLADELEDGSLDTLVDSWLTSDRELSPAARLMLVTTRLQGDDADLDQLATHLTELSGVDDEPLAEAAAGLLGDPMFRQLEVDTREAAFEALRAGMEDSHRAASFRLTCASALHAIGRGAEQRDARRAMVEYLDSGRVELRGLGALALAATGDVNSGRGELERLASLPGDRGRLAAAYLKTEDLRRYYDRKHQNLEAWYTEKLSNDDSLEEDAELGRLERVIRMIKLQALEGDKHTREELIEAAIDGMLHSLDRHSSYMPPERFKNFNQDLLEPVYGGIGAYVNEDPDDGLFTITRPIYSGPAYRAGLQSDDKIVRIDDWPTVLPGGGSHPTDDIIKRLKGKPETTVKLYIWRQGMDAELIDRPTEEMAVNVTRAQITIPPVHAEMLPGKIGLFELTSFTRVASRELAREMQRFVDRGMRAVILDLRRNSGGLLDESKDVSELFLPAGKLVVSTESRRGAPDELETERPPLVGGDVPVVVLIDRFSASASEIVSGALQDHNRATLVGQRSFGKGSVQQLLPILGESDDRFADENRNGRFDPWEELTQDHNGNGEFDFAPRARLTIARWLRPSGQSIHRELDEEGNLESLGGVAPDHEVGPRTFERWKLREFRRVNSERELKHWADERFPENRETFLQLAAGDRGDWTQYPGFEELYQTLETTLSREDVRFLLRREVRRRVQDERGAAFPAGDYQEDPQLQKAVQVALEDLGESYRDLPQYADTFEDIEATDHSEAPLTADLTDARRSELRHALSLIMEARSGEGGLSGEGLAELEKLIEATLDNKN